MEKCQNAVELVFLIGISKELIYSIIPMLHKTHLILERYVLSVYLEFQPDPSVTNEYYYLLLCFLFFVIGKG